MANRRDDEPNANVLGSPQRFREVRGQLFQEGLKGALTTGSIGLVGHALAQKFWPVYRNKFYVQGKVFLLSSAFVIGFWVCGEQAFHEHMRDQAEEEGRMK
eukprot:gb/GECG01009229.1/.p1 GENE.gb/GECG01009229.1/~~gb/GECG01009229.1/.p1  ORF type:complete len:101 (+),score=12.06 gb/GECG01009229.1/:1-303(+)